MDERQFNHDLGALIKQARQDAGLTQELLAKASDISRGSIANIELGDQAPPPYRLVRIASALGVEPGSLLPRIESEGAATGRAEEVGMPPEIVAHIKALAGTAMKKKAARDGSR